MKTRSNTKTKRGRTLILPAGKKAKWDKWLDENCLASAGPYPNISGMREKHWGMPSLIVKSGIYIYLIANRDDGRTMPWEG